MKNGLEKEIKNSLEELEKGFKPHSNPSSLSLGTIKSLVSSRLENLPDWKPDESSQEMNTKWEGPSLYEAPTLDKDWFVWFKYQHPITGKFIRFKYHTGFGRLKTKTQRREHGRRVVAVFKELFREGWSPFAKYGEETLETNKTVTFCITKYLHNLDQSKNTKSKYTTELTLFKKWLTNSGHENLLMEDVKKSTIMEFMESQQREKGWNPKTYNTYLNDITTFFNYYFNNYDDVLYKVPSKSLKRKKVDRPGNSAFTDYQFKELKDLMAEHGDEMLYTFCSFIYYAALRNEAEGNYIKAGDFNFNTKTLRIDSANAKNRKTEYIPLYPEFLDLLYKLGIDKMEPSLYVFGKTKDSWKADFKIGAPYPVGRSYFGDKFRKYKKMVGLSSRDGIYCYKHTRAVHLGEDGEDLYKIMKLFRHRDLATTMIYMRDLGVNTQNDTYTKGRSF